MSGDGFHVLIANHECLSPRRKLAIIIAVTRVALLRFMIGGTECVNPVKRGGDEAGNDA